MEAHICVWMSDRLRTCVTAKQTDSSVHGSHVKLVRFKDPEKEMLYRCRDDRKNKRYRDSL